MKFDFERLSIARLWDEIFIAMDAKRARERNDIKDGGWLCYTFSKGKKEEKYRIADDDDFGRAILMHDNFKYPNDPRKEFELAYVHGNVHDDIHDIADGSLPDSDAEEEGDISESGG